MQKCEWNIGGVTNSQTKTALKNALNKLDGVSSIDVDLANETLQVKYNEPATEEEIRECVITTGFYIK